MCNIEQHKSVDGYSRKPKGIRGVFHKYLLLFIFFCKRTNIRHLNENNKNII